MDLTRGGRLEVVSRNRSVKTCSVGLRWKAMLSKRGCKTICRCSDESSVSDVATSLQLIVLRGDKSEEEVCNVE